MEISKFPEDEERSNSSGAYIDEEEVRNNGRLLIVILVLTILSFMTLVIFRCLVDYRKFQKSFRIGEIEKQGQCFGSKMPRRLRNKEFKEELEMVVNRRQERLGGGQGDGNGDGRGTSASTSTAARHSNVQNSNLKANPKKTIRTKSDIDPDAIEEQEALFA